MCRGLVEAQEKPNCHSHLEKENFVQEVALTKVDKEGEENTNKW